MFLLGAKTQNFIATTILASAVMVCGRAEAADVTTQMERLNSGWMRCWAINNGPYNVCAVYDVYPVWQSFHPTHGTVAFNFSGGSRHLIAWGHINQSPALRCKLISAKYQQPYSPCNP